MKPLIPLGTLTIVANLLACASVRPPDETLVPDALRAAEQRGAAELGCSAAKAVLTSKGTVEEPQATGWYEPPHRADYTVAVAGCGKQVTYSIACDDRQRDCTAAPLATAAAPPQPLADKMQPGAVKAAQQFSASEFSCAETTAEVMDRETISEPQGTGWYEPPHVAKYSINVSGCGRRGMFTVACDDRQARCAISSVAPAAPAPRSVADEMRPDAVQAAQRLGASALNCPAAVADVVTGQTLEEPQTTGWYEPAHRAGYTVSVSGCGKRATYAIVCDDRSSTAKCIAGSAGSSLRE
jgi:hypothetical protein